jgi:menaquinone-dependent protoporphyrinogen oxidase
MNVLITAASRHGATLELADAIAARLAEHGHTTVVRRPKDVVDLAGFDAVVLGSAVYTGRWLGEAREFADTQAHALRLLPVWVFASGPIGDPPLPASPADDTGAVAGEIGARAAVTFAGKLTYASLGRGERLIVRAVRARDGDHRDWAAVRAFADEISAALAPAPV